MLPQPEPEPKLIFAVPGSITTRTGGSIYDRRVSAALRDRGWNVDIVECSGDFPAPSETDLLALDRVLGSCPDRALVMIDGLIFGAIPGMAARHAARLRLVALVHHPLALETGLGVEAIARYRDAEQRALRCAAGVITTSQPTAAILIRDYAVAPGRITIAPPGTDRPAHRGRDPAQPTIALLAVGAVIPRKGYDVLVEALRQLADLDFACLIIGTTERCPATVAALRAAIRAGGLDHRITLAGEVDDVDRAFANADIFVLPSRYEGYGMVFGEALAHGLPIVATLAGAIPSVVPADAGHLVPVDDPIALADALRGVITEPEHRARLAAGSRRAARDLPDWTDTARLIGEALRKLPD